MMLSSPHPVSGYDTYPQLCWFARRADLPIPAVPLIV